jgi:glycosyltransferase involved in cell wall biosynthesis
VSIGLTAALPGLKLRKSGGVRVTSAAHRLIQRGDRARDARRWSEAAMAYEEALAIDGSLAHIWIQLGHARKEMGETTEAEQAYDRAVRLEPASAEPHLHLGHLHKVRGSLAEAGRSYLRATQLDAGQGDAVGELMSLAAGSLPVSREVLVSLAGEEPLGVGGSPPLSAVRQVRASLTELLARLPADDDPRVSLLSELDRLERRLDAVAAPASAAALVFDVSDLISYFRNARLPTGIQRVQIETIAGALAEGQGRAIHVCAFAEQRDEWVEIPREIFIPLCQLSLAGGDRGDAAWIRAIARLQLLTSTAAALEMPQGSYLINLGTSWWLQNYFLMVREAKRTRNVRYVPFVHDFIPVMAPEHCVKELTQDFISWAIGAFDHADHFLVNSQSTKRDLLAVADYLDRPVAEDDVVVVRLDGDIRKSALAPLSASSLARWGLVEGDFVLFVSTVEARKNHLGAFDAWISLMRRRGRKRTPKLVCVGNRGWLNDAVYARLAADEELASRVLMLQGLSDLELDLLYRSCLFTLYPSRYEGWGLPVTESLCHGKVPLCSDATSLPEAGGAFAVYFAAESSEQMADAAERLAFEADYRVRLERRIADEFRPRSWPEVAATIAHAASGWSQRQPAVDRLDAGLAVRLGAYHPIVRNFERRLRPGMRSGEIFRAGTGWWWPDDWGCWTKAQGGCLRLVMPETPGPFRLLLQLHGLPTRRTGFSVEVVGAGLRADGDLLPGAFRWVALDIAEAPADRILTLHVSGDAVEDLAAITNGADPRVAGIGVCGFHVCLRDDVAARADFLEAAALGNLTDLSFNRPRPGDDQRPHPGR